MSLKNLIKVADYYNVKYGFDKIAENSSEIPDSISKTPPERMGVTTVEHFGPGKNYSEIPRTQNTSEMPMEMSVDPPQTTDSSQPNVNNSKQLANIQNANKAKQQANIDAINKARQQQANQKAMNKAKQQNIAQESQGKKSFNYDMRRGFGVGKEV